jgi:hypothetical protein
MKERPILFSGPMVRALLEGRKTQTRRLIKPQPKKDPMTGDFVLMLSPHHGVTGLRSWLEACPYGQPGERLWVKEAAYIAKPNFGDPQFDTHKDNEGRGRVVDYAATMDADAVRCAEDFGVKKTPSIHMPRWASRLLLEVVEVRAERLQDITEADAIAEGARHFPDLPSLSRYGQDPRWSFFDATSVDQCLGSARHAFGNAWNKINGARADWDANPWVWAISFKRIQPETGGAK